MIKGDVLVHTPTTLTGYDDVIDNLREALAEMIVQRGEYVMRKEAKITQAYGGQPRLPGIPSSNSKTSMVRPFYNSERAS